MADDHAEAVRTALMVRGAAQDLWDKFNQSHAGVPETGPVERGVKMKWEEHRPVLADIVRPVGEGPHPVLVYIHGGGWVAGRLDDYFQLAGRFAEQGFVVVAVDYSLAPEAPFPAGYDDIVAATRWVCRNIEHYGGDPKRIAMAGDSAGANLSAAVAASQPDLSIRALGLIYGTFDFETMGTDPVFRDMLLRAYLGEGVALELARDPRIGPIHAAEQLPPAYILLGSADNPSVVAQARLLAERMRAAGIAHEHVVVDDYEHGFLQMETLPETLPEIARISAFLRQHLNA